MHRDGRARVVKVGGSLVTDKHREYVFDADGARRIAEELTGLDDPIIVVHGTGSYGKPPARTYGYTDGVIGRARAQVVAEVHGRLDELRARVLAVFRDAGLAAFGVAGASIFTTADGVIESCRSSWLLALLERRLIPVVSADLVVDRTRDFVVCSSDAMAARLAVDVAAPALVFATDVEGVIGDGAVIPELSPDLYARLDVAAAVGDVSGGMRGKLDAAFRAAAAGVPTQIVSGRVPGRVRDALGNRPVVGTRLLDAAAGSRALVVDT